MILVHMDSKSHCDMKSRFRQNQEKNYTLGFFIQGSVLHHCCLFESHSESGREAKERNVCLDCVKRKLRKHLIFTRLPFVTKVSKVNKVLNSRDWHNTVNQPKFKSKK